MSNPAGPYRRARSRRRRYDDDGSSRQLRATRRDARPIRDAGVRRRVSSGNRSVDRAQRECRPEPDPPLLDRASRRDPRSARQLRRHTGRLLIQVVAIGDCKAISGAQISASQANAKVAYFSAGLPQAGRTYAAGVGIPSAIVYNLVPGAAVDVTVVSPWCATADRPVTLDNVTYYEVVPVAAGTLAFERVFIGRVPPESIPSN